MAQSTAVRTWEHERNAPHPLSSTPSLTSASSPDTRGIALHFLSFLFLPCSSLHFPSLPFPSLPNRCRTLRAPLRPHSISRPEGSYRLGLMSVSLTPHKGHNANPRICPCPLSVLLWLTVDRKPSLPNNTPTTKHHCLYSVHIYAAQQCGLLCLVTPGCHGRCSHCTY